MNRSDLPPRQLQVLEIIIEDVGSVFDQTEANQRLIADRIGWKNTGGVLDCLYALRAKGFLTSERRRREDGRMCWRWSVVEKERVV